MKPHPKHNQGFSLIETMIYVSLLIVIVGIFTAFTADIVRGAARIIDKKMIVQNNRFVLDKMLQEIKTSQNVEVSPDAKELTLLDASSTLVRFFSNEDEQAIYFNDGTQNLRLTEAGVRASDLKFTTVGSYGIRLEYNLAKVKLSTNFSKPFELKTSQVIVPRGNLY